MENDSLTLYIIKETYSSRSASALINNPQDRNDAIQPLVEDLGGKLCHFYIACNEDTAYLIIKLPDEKSLAALLIAIKASGAVKSITATPVMTASDAVDVFKQASTVNYRPPAS